MQVGENLPPTPELWGDPGADPDLASAMELFLGKTNEDIVPLLEGNYLIGCLDLRAMPDLVFGYCGIGFSEFLLRGDINEGRLGVLLGAFLDAASHRLEFWRRTVSLLQRFSDKLDACEMNEENKAELAEELSEIRSEILQA